MDQQAGVPLQELFGGGGRRPGWHRRSECCSGALPGAAEVPGKHSHDKGHHLIHISHMYVNKKPKRTKPIRSYIMVLKDTEHSKN